MDALALLEASPALLVAAAVVLGLVVGSFLNVVIHRLPRMLEAEWRAECAELLGRDGGGTEGPRMTLLSPGSSCPHCGHRIRPVENIPLASYAALRGRCAGCGARISARYPAVEAAAGLLSGVVAWRLGFGWETATALVFTWALLALAVIDIEHQLLPDNLTLPLLWAGLTVALIGLHVPLREAVIGALAGYLALWAVYQVFRLATGKEGMGFGDFKLLAALGAWLGWQALPVVILLASAVGAVTGMALIAVRRHDRRAPIPFGPYLAAAGWIALLWGDALTQAYLDWVSGPL